MRKGFHTGSDPRPIVEGMRANPGTYLVVGLYYSDTRYDFDRARAVVRALTRENREEFYEREARIEAWGSTLRYVVGTHLKPGVHAQHKVRGVWLTQRLLDAPPGVVSQSEVRAALIPTMAEPTK